MHANPDPRWRTVLLGLRLRLRLLGRRGRGETCSTTALCYRRARQAGRGDSRSRAAHCPVRGLSEAGGHGRRDSQRSGWRLGKPGRRGVAILLLPRLLLLLMLLVRKGWRRG